MAFVSTKLSNWCRKFGHAKKETVPVDETADLLKAENLESKFSSLCRKDLDFFCESLKEIENSKTVNSKCRKMLVVWLDPSISEMDNDIVYSLSKLESTGNEVKTFSEIPVCLEFIRKVVDREILSIVSGAISTSSVPELECFYLVRSILIFCRRKRAYKHLTKESEKVKLVSTEIEEICSKIVEENHLDSTNFIPFHFDAPAELNEFDDSIVRAKLFRRIVLESNENENFSFPFSNKTLSQFRKSENILDREKTRHVQRVFSGAFVLNETLAIFRKNLGRKFSFGKHFFGAENQRKIDGFAGKTISSIDLNFFLFEIRAEQETFQEKLFFELDDVFQLEQIERIRENFFRVDLTFIPNFRDEKIDAFCDNFLLTNRIFYANFRFVDFFLKFRKIQNAQILLFDFSTRENQQNRNEVFHFFARIREKQNRFDEAQRFYTIFNQVSMINSRTQKSIVSFNVFSSAKVYIELNRFDEAMQIIDHYRRLTNFHESNDRNIDAQIFLLQARINRDKNRFDAALKYFRKAEQVFRNNPSCFQQEIQQIQENISALEHQTEL